METWLFLYHIVKSCISLFVLKIHHSSMFNEKGQCTHDLLIIHSLYTCHHQRSAAVVTCTCIDVSSVFNQKTHYFTQVTRTFESIVKSCSTRFVWKIYISSMFDEKGGYFCVPYFSCYHQRSAVVKCFCINISSIFHQTTQNLTCLRSTHSIVNSC